MLEVERLNSDGQFSLLTDKERFALNQRLQSSRLKTKTVIRKLLQEAC